MTAPTPSPSAALPGAFQAHSLDQVKAALAAGRRLPSRAGCSSAGVSAVPVGFHPIQLQSGWTAADGEPRTNCV